MCGFLCIFRAFPVCALCSSVFSFLQSLPPPPCSPFQFVPLFHCVFHTFLVCVFCPVVSTFPCPPCLLLFYGLCPSLLSFLCVRLLTHALYFPCVPFIPVLLPLCRPFCPSFSVLGLSVPLMRVFSLVAPPSRCYLPFFSVTFSSSSFFISVFSFPFSPLLSSPFLSFVFH